MKVQLQPRSVDGWFWIVTLALLVWGLLGRREGFAGAIVVSALQVGYFAWRDGSLGSFATQVRWAYLALAVLFWFDRTRLLYAVMLLSTIMVAFFDRCVLAMVLQRAPWNRGRPDVPAPPQDTP